MMLTLQSFQRRARLVVGLLAVLVTPTWLPAEPVPAADDRVVAQMVCEILQSGHVTRPTIDDDISKRLFQRFLKDLDPANLTSSRATSTNSRSTKPSSDDMLLKGDIELRLQGLRPLHRARRPAPAS